MSADILERNSIIVNPILSPHESDLNQENFTFRLAGMPKAGTVMEPREELPHDREQMRKGNKTVGHKPSNSVLINATRPIPVTK